VIAKMIRSGHQSGGGRKNGGVHLSERKTTIDAVLYPRGEVHPVVGVLLEEAEAPLEDIKVVVTMVATIGVMTIGGVTIGVTETIVGIGIVGLGMRRETVREAIQRSGDRTSYGKRKKEKRKNF